MGWFTKRPAAETPAAVAPETVATESLYLGAETEVASPPSPGMAPFSPTADERANSIDVDLAPGPAMVASGTDIPTDSMPASPAAAVATPMAPDAPQGLGARLRAMIPGKSTAAVQPATLTVASSADPAGQPVMSRETLIEESLDPQSVRTQAMEGRSATQPAATVTDPPVAEALIHADPSAEELEATAAYAATIEGAGETGRPAGGLQSLYADAKPVVAPKVKKPGLIARLRKEQPDEPGFLPAWRRGDKGRPSQLFIGFMPQSTKKDAIAYAI